MHEKKQVIKIGYEEAILESFKKNNVDYVVHIPDKVLLPVVELIEKDGTMKSVLVTREEEGIAMCSGLYMAGKRPAIMMQSSGIGNSITAITSILMAHSIPLVIIMSYRGSLYEYNPADTQLGTSLPKLMESLSVPFYIPQSLKELSDELNGAFPLSETSQKPVAFAINADILRRSEQ